MSLRYALIAMTLGLILLSICLLFSKQIILPEGMYVNETRNTDGTLTFTVRTVTYNGQYRPRNAGAIWITNSSNQFIKTIKVWAQTYRWTLVKWVASSGNNTTGAITSASLTTHQLHTVTWNGMNSSNVLVPDGDYKINVEFTEHNATTSNPGKYKYVTFTKGPASVDESPANETYFTTMHTVWAPVAPPDGTISGIVTNSLSSPVSGAVITAGTLNTLTDANGAYTITAAPGTYNMTCTATGCFPQTHNDVVVSSSQTTTVNFALDVVANDDHANISQPAVLNQNYPNPFNTNTSIGYYLPEKAMVTMNIYNVKGQVISKLVNSKQNGGWHSIGWNGVMENGRKAVPGKYYCKLRIDNTELTRIVTLTR